MLVMVVPKLEAYIRHVSNGVSMRALAREKQIRPSTVKRMIDTITDLRDAVPEWDEIITQLEDHFRAEDKPAHVNQHVIARFFGSQLAAAEHRFSTFKAILSSRRMMLAMAKTGSAGILDGETVVAKVDRNMALIWIGCGWIGLKKLPEEGKVRLYISHDVEPVTQIQTRTPAAYANRSPAATTVLQRSLDDEDIRTLHQFRLVWATRDKLGKAIIDRAQHELHPVLFSALMEFSDNTGSFQRLEEVQDLPARSGKVILTIALQHIAKYEEMCFSQLRA